MGKSNIYPIIIPLKKTSVRLPYKNRILLKYTLEYVKQYGNENIYLLTDDNEIIEKYNNTYNVILDTNKKNDILYAINDCANKLNSEYVFFLCVTNPFREDGILYKMINELEQNTPMVTTKIIVPNRRIFLINNDDKFIYKSKKGRKGKYVKESFMIDGSAYLINTTFLKQICQTNNPNKLLWESNFKTVLNEVPFADIDTERDLNNFNFLRNIIK